MYPLLLDETCCLLAIDFDKGNWQDDARAFLDACGRLQLLAALERSRSGRGGHVWLFFEDRFGPHWSILRAVNHRGSASSIGNIITVPAAFADRLCTGKSLTKGRSSMDRQELLGEIGLRLLKVHGRRLHGVVLYSSEARGEARSDSDIDVLVGRVSSARGARCRP
ncbi:MAG: TOTE conflict system archaeo-eukaryotic primase domain-containing protein [Vicinamibacterales bacterium]